LRAQHGSLFFRWLLCIHLFLFFAFSHHLYMVGHWPSSSLSIGCMVSLRGDWAIFYNAGSGRVGKAWSARKNSLGILRRGWELNMGYREARQWAIPLSYQDCLCLYLQEYFLLNIKVVNIECNSVLVATLNEGGEEEFCNRWVILTLIIHWLGPASFSPWCSPAMLAVNSRRLAKGPYQGSNLAGSETRTCNPLIATRGFHRLSYSGSILKT